MQEIDLSVFNRGENGALLQPMLDDFERLHNTHVNLQLLDWEAGWTELVEVALYGHGPDLSEVASTWVMDFVRMNAVRNASPAEMGRIGSEKDFFPTNWKSGVVTNPNEPQLIWAIPWTSDVRLAYYRRDLFEQAGLDPLAAFAHIASLDEAVQKLKGQGMTMPAALGTLRSRISLHNIASWLWDAGADFLAPEGNRVGFDSPNALRGMQYYFELGKYIPAEHRKITDIQADRLFIAGDASVLFSGPWILINSDTPKHVQENLGMTAMPGASFVGGTHILTWKHTRNREMALTLADFLIKHSAEHNIFPAYGLPGYVPSWQKVHFIAEPYFSTLLDSLQKGRSFPIGQLWGLVEKRLTDAMPGIWERILESGQGDVSKVLAETLVPLADRINTTLE